MDCVFQLIKIIMLFHLCLSYCQGRWIMKNQYMPRIICYTIVFAKAMANCVWRLIFMGLIPDDKKELLKNDFKEKLVDPVKIVMFTQEIECRYCSRHKATSAGFGTSKRQNNRRKFYDFVKDAAKANEYGIDKIPAIAIIGKKDYGVRIYGIPYGYELQTLIEAIIKRFKRTNRPLRKNQIYSKRSKISSSHQSLRHPNLPPLPCSSRSRP